MRRSHELMVAGLAAAAALVWLLALLTSRPSALPVVVVQGEPTLTAGMPWALRLSAVSTSSTARLPIEGWVHLAGSTAAIVDGTARIAAGAPGPARLDVVVGGVKLHGTIDVKAGASAPTALTWSHWTHEVAMGSGAPGAARDAVYPLDGRVSARLPSSVLVVSPGVREQIALSPQAQGPMLADGRVLAVDRSGLRVEIERVTPAQVSAVVTSAEPQRVSCDLLIDGAVHDVATFDVPQQARVHLQAGQGAREGYVVVHCGSPWPDDRGRTVVAPAGDAQGAWVAGLALAAGARTDEPILAAVDDERAITAALARLRPAKVRAPKLPIVWRGEVGPHAMLRAMYALLALLVVGMTLALGLARYGERRGAVVGAALALSLLLGGMYAALVIGAR